MKNWICAGLALLFASTLVSCSTNTETSASKEQPSTSSQVSPTPVRSPSAGELLPGAVVLEENIYDTPLKTQVELRIAVPLNTTKAQLDRYMPQLYREQLARTGFKARPNPNSVYAFIFLEGSEWKGAGWVARIAKAAADDRPTFNNNLVDGSLLAQVRESLKGGEVSLDGTTIRITDSYDGEFWEDSTTKEIGDSMMKSVFWTTGTVYGTVGALDEVEWVFIHRGKTVGDVKLTRASYDALNYDAEMESVFKIETAAWDAVSKNKLSSDQAEARTNKALRAAYRRLLKRLPDEAAQIKKPYRP